MSLVEHFHCVKGPNQSFEHRRVLGNFQERNYIIPTNRGDERFEMVEKHVETIFMVNAQNFDDKISEIEEKTNLIAEHCRSIEKGLLQVLENL